MAGAARRRWLRASARRVAHHPRENAAQAAALGRLLLEVKSVVGHGRFSAWLETHFIPTQGSLRIARECMQAAKKFSEIGALRSFQVSALRLLAKRRLPKERLQQVLRQAESSRGIGYNKTLYLISGIREESESAADVFDEADETPAAAAGRRLLTLVDRADVIHLAIDRDPETPSVSITTMSDTRGRQHVLRTSLDQALAAAAGEEAQRTCPKCGEEKPVEGFAQNTSFCRICERARVREYDRKKRNHAGSDAASG